MKKKHKTSTGALPNSAGFPGRDMVADIDRRTDAQKLLDIADWFDMRDMDNVGHLDDNELQLDLRRIAAKLNKYALTFGG